MGKYLVKNLIEKVVKKPYHDFQSFENHGIEILIEIPKEIGFEAKTDFIKGLKNTIKRYRPTD